MSGLAPFPGVLPRVGDLAAGGAGVERGAVTPPVTLNLRSRSLRSRLRRVRLLRRLRILRPAASAILAIFLVPAGGGGSSGSSWFLRPPGGNLMA